MKSDCSRRLSEFLTSSGVGRCIVLTGAGCSTESGIPDYRGPHGRYRRRDFVPLTFQKFLSDNAEKQRYWARSMIGYQAMLGASCNSTHLSLYALSVGGIVSHIITQNVDGLHHLAQYGGVGDASSEGVLKYTKSSYPLTELHGNIHNVICLDCGHIRSRFSVQLELLELNRGLVEMCSADKSMARPDGDYAVPLEVVPSMKLTYCQICGGHIKPHVVLFGENVARTVVDRTVALVRSASCLVCMGTSLEVFSAFRYVSAAKEAGVPIAIVTSGQTRADGLEDLKIDTPKISAVVSEVTSALLGK